MDMQHKTFRSFTMPRSAFRKFGLRALGAAMAGSDAKTVFTRLLETILGTGAPESVVVFENNPWRPPKVTGTGGASGVQGVGFSCVPVARFLVTLDGEQRTMFSMSAERSQDVVLRPGQFCWVEPGYWYLVRNDRPRTMFSVVFFEDFTRFVWYHHKRETVGGEAVAGRGRDTPGAAVSLHYHTHAPAGTGLREALALMERARREQAAAAVGTGKADAGGRELLWASAHALMAWCLEELRHERIDTNVDASVSGGDAGTGVGAAAGEAVAGRRTVGEICAHVTEHLHGDLSREQMAARFGISEDHLTRLFRLHARCGFSEFVNAERFRLAENLLRQGRFSVKEVGAACGFNSSAYFVKRFREQHGVTPTAWRQQGKSMQGRGGGARARAFQGSEVIA